MDQVYGIAIIPMYLKTAAIGSVLYGKGLLMVKKASGNWSDPVFISISGFSLRPRIGFETGKMVLVCKSKGAVDRILNGRFKFEVDASAATESTGVNTGMNASPADVLVFVRGQSCFLGISASAALISVERAHNSELYGIKNVTPKMIFAGCVEAPEAIQDLVTDMNEYTATN